MSPVLKSQVFGVPWRNKKKKKEKKKTGEIPAMCECVNVAGSDPTDLFPSSR
jgi:hypothetical protein